MKNGPKVRYGIHPSPFGTFLLATIHGEVCALVFLQKGGAAEALRDLKRIVSGVSVVRDQKHIDIFARKIFAVPRKNVKIPLVLSGTDFQIRVWDALCTIPFGRTMTYAEVARKIGSPKSARAVGTACGKNAIAYLVPCHRVLASSGAVGGYRWGIARKKALLAWEGFHP